MAGAFDRLKEFRRDSANTCAAMSAPRVGLLVVVTALLSAGASFAVAVNVDRGPAGPRGQTGRAGPQGPQGDADVATEDVVNAVEDDPQSVADALSGFLDYQDIQQQLDPEPSDVESEVQDLQTTVDGLCNDLTFSAAVENDMTAC